jgi:hypothetical protein
MTDAELRDEAAKVIRDILLDRLKTWSSKTLANAVADFLVDFVACEAGAFFPGEVELLAARMEDRTNSILEAG